MLDLCEHLIGVTRPTAAVTTSLLPNRSELCVIRSTEWTALVHHGRVHGSAARTRCRKWRITEAEQLHEHVRVALEEFHDFAPLVLLHLSILIVKLIIGAIQVGPITYKILALQVLHDVVLAHDHLASLDLDELH